MSVIPSRGAERNRLRRAFGRPKMFGDERFESIGTLEPHVLHRLPKESYRYGQQGQSRKRGAAGSSPLRGSE
jgi:hypothetical protein